MATLGSAIAASLVLAGSGLTSCALTGCAPPDFRTCATSGGSPILLTPFRGEFLHHIDGVEVLEGDYEPPPLTGQTTRTTFSFGTTFAIVRLRDVAWVGRISSRIHLIDAEPGPCAGRFMAAPVQPPPLACNAAVISWTDLGDSVLLVDPTLVSFEPGFAPPEEDAYLPQIEGDDEGITLRTVHAVQPRGCFDHTCWSIVRVSHRFDRLE